MKKYFTIALLFAALFSNAQPPVIKISANKRFFATGKDQPFFWLGDTGWLLFKKCKKQDVIKYLDDRKKKGYNVIQVMLLHELTVTDAYGDSALHHKNIGTPNVTDGYWNNVDFVIAEAAKRSMYIGLVPIWGGNVKSGLVNETNAATYAAFLAERYKSKSNIIWINGGDIKGSDGENIWNVIGKTLHEKDGIHLVTFHPRGRSTSSAWFHNQDWLDFNMFQSGHKDYAQDTTEPRIGEDNWKFAMNDYTLQPVKPTLDGEPSYENIPHGLHDSAAKRWTAADVRRYAYWSVFAGGCGFTYGNNSIMQFYRNGDKDMSFGANKNWDDELNAPGAGQMQYLKKLMLQKAYMARVPDQSMVLENGTRYNYIAATRAETFALFYTYSGRKFKVALDKIEGALVNAYWINPRNGSKADIGLISNKGTKTFDPPGIEKEGNDWVLVLDTVLEARK
ncbi:glycoside hydrolase family 140 protein [Ferruginibacter sp.]